MFDNKKPLTAEEKKYRDWEFEYPHLEWEDFRDNYEPCNRCNGNTDKICICYKKVVKDNS